MSLTKLGARTMVSHYRCLNEELAEEVIRQVGPRTQEADVTWTIKTPIGERASRRSGPVQSTMDKVELAEDLLRDTGILRSFRPETASAFRDFNNAESNNPWFCFEWLPMTPVHLPSRELGPRSFTPDLTVWVADPLDQNDVDRQNNPQPDFVGSFLFLVEEVRTLPTIRFISGISALRLLVDFVAKDGAFRMKDLLDARRTNDELGRFNSIHPIAKLESVGGYVGRRRPVATVYRIVYMTDEQGYTTEQGEQVRLNDILAYPLYIGE